MCDHEPKHARGMCRKCYEAERYQIDRLKRRQQHAEYYQRNKLQISTRQAANYQKTKIKRLIHQKLQLKVNRQYAIARRFRHRCYMMVKNKFTSTQELVGCNWKFLIKYLESKFSAGMTWQSMGR
jgi:hypothetical protein